MFDEDQAKSSGPGIPALGMLAGRTLLDAIISYSTETTEEANIESLSLAWHDLVQSDASTEELLESTLGASTIIQTWLINQLSRASGRDVEMIVNDLRAFLADHAA